MIIGFAFAVEVFRSTLKSIIRSNFISHARYVERLPRRCVHPAAAENSNFFSSRTWRCLISHQSLDLDCIMNSYIFSYIFQASAEDCRREQEEEYRLLCLCLPSSDDDIFFLRSDVSFRVHVEFVFYLFSLRLLSCIQLTILCFILLHAAARCHLLWFLLSQTGQKHRLCRRWSLLTGSAANIYKTQVYCLLRFATGWKTQWFSEQCWFLISCSQPASSTSEMMTTTTEEARKGNKKYIASEVASEAESQAANNNKCAR